MNLTKFLEMTITEESLKAAQKLREYMDNLIYKDIFGLKEKGEDR